MMAAGCSPAKKKEKFAMIGLADVQK